MMTSVDNRIDELISRVKKQEPMKAFAFIPGYPAHKTPNPVTKYTVAAADSEVKVKWHYIGNHDTIRVCEAEVCLRVYAPENSSGASLLRASSLLMNALEAVDSGREISWMKLSGIGFDTASRTEYRDVTVKLELEVRM